MSAALLSSFLGPGLSELAAPITALLSRGPGLCPQNPWSLAELRLQESEFQHLLEWFAALDASDIRNAFNGILPPVRVGDETIGGQACFGLLLLTLISEIARRDASEGRLWPPVRQRLAVNRSACALMFDAGGQPAAPLKVLIERAARRFSLRHAFDVFDDDGPGHQWYTTVFLQFGFTRKGPMRNAEYWMRNLNLPKAVRLLLADSASTTGRASFTSPSFAHAWTTMLLWARRNIVRQEAARRLGASLWVLAESVDEILDRISKVDWSKDSFADVAIDQLDAHTPPSFIGRLWWRSETAAPAIVVELSGLSILELAVPFYDVIVEGRRLARLLISGPDDLRLIGPPEYLVDSAAFHLRVPQPYRPTLSVLLLDPSGVAVAEQTLPLWPVDCTCSVFAIGDNSSRILDLGRPLPTTGDLLLIADSACRLLPELGDVYELNDGRHFASRLPVETRSEVRLMLGPHEAWRPMTGSSTPSGPPTLAPECTARPVRGDTVREGDFIEIEMRHAPTIEIKTVWYCAQEHESKSREPGRTLARLAYKTQGVPGLVHLLIVSAGPNGLPSVHSREAALPVTGLFRQRGGRFEPAESTRRITRGSLLAGLYTYIPPHVTEDPSDDQSEWYIFEGVRPVARFPKRGQPRYSVVGLGAPLTVRRGPLNARRGIQLASGVVDFGEFRASHDLRADGDGALNLHVHDTLLGQLNEYACVIWDRSGVCTSGQIVEQDDARRGFAAVRVLPSMPVQAPLAVGLAYRGVRIGAVWREDWYRFVRDLAARGAHRASALLRWLHVPVLEPRTVSAIRHELLEHSAGDLFAAWSAAFLLRTDDGELEFGAADPGFVQAGLLDNPWLTALRETTFGWLPTPPSVATLLDQLVSSIPNSEIVATPLISAVLRLMRIHPRLAVLSFRRYLDAHIAPALARTIERALACAVAGVTTPQQIVFEIDQLEQQSAASLSALLRQTVDVTFVRSLSQRAKDLGYFTDSPSRETPPQLDFDTELLCQLPHGRRLLTLACLRF